MPTRARVCVHAKDRDGEKTVGGAGESTLLNPLSSTFAATHIHTHAHTSQAKRVVSCHHQTFLSFWDWETPVLEAFPAL